MFRRKFFETRREVCGATDVWRGASQGVTDAVYQMGANGWGNAESRIKPLVLPSFQREKNDALVRVIEGQVVTARPEWE